MIGIHWEEGGKKIPLPLPPQKEKNWTIQACVLILFFVFLPCSISTPAIS
jgi:hypothetical protein